MGRPTIVGGEAEAAVAARIRAAARRSWLAVTTVAEGEGAGALIAAAAAARACATRFAIIDDDDDGNRDGLVDGNGITPIPTGGLPEFIWC
jgi:hypothetical protein